MHFGFCEIFVLYRYGDPLNCIHQIIVKANNIHKDKNFSFKFNLPRGGQIKDRILIRLAIDTNQISL